MITVFDTGHIDGGAYRIVELADGSARVEEWRGGKWVPGGASFGEIADAPPVGAAFAARLGIPAEDITTAPTRPEPRLPTPAEADDLCGRAFLEAARELLAEQRDYEKVLVGPVMVNGLPARLIKEPNGSGRFETWRSGVGWIEAPEGSMALSDFMPGATRPVSPANAARFGMPKSEI
jgi:hypothetical protein